MISTYNGYKKSVVNEIEQALSGVDEIVAERFVYDLLDARKIFVVGVGRVLLSLKAFEKRLNHLGIQTFFVGEINEPAITEKDLLIVGSGSGESIFPVSIARKAKNYGAKIVHIGSNTQSSMKEIANYMIRIPVQTKLYLDDEVKSDQPMTSLFEQSLLVFGDIICKMIIDDKGIDINSLWEYHANLE